MKLDPEACSTNPEAFVEVWVLKTQHRDDMPPNDVYTIDEGVIGGV